MPRPCEKRHPEPIPADCPLCWKYVNVPKWAAAWGRPAAERRTLITLPCVHEGAPARGPAPGKTYYTCDAGKGVVCKCNCGPACDKYAADIEPAVPSGVVIGHYGMPKIIEVQVRLIREHCGPVPILVHDDHSPEPHRADLDATCAALGVEVVRSGRENIGHAGGDLGAFYRGLEWAQARGLRVLVKLSQRFLVDTPGWLATAADLLLDSRESCLSDACIEGQCRLPLRTEGMVMDVRRWAGEEPMRVLRPRRVYPSAAEHIVHQALRRVGGGFRVWPLLGGPHRQTRTPGVLWHCFARPDEYRALAARFGVDLGEAFFTHGWPKGKREDWG